MSKKKTEFASLEDLNHFVKVVNEEFILTQGHGHRLYRGFTNQYTRKYCSTFPSGATMRVYTHEAILLHKLGILQRAQGYETSHLCHVQSCINPEHLACEPKSMNNERKHCNDERKRLGSSTYCRPQGHGESGPCLRSD